MAIPVRDDGSPGPTKHLIVFVHGFCSSPATWDRMLAALKSDDSLSEQYEFCVFQYETHAVVWSPLRRLPEIDEVGRELDDFLKEKLGNRDNEAYISTTLVGHSMGGLVIQSYVRRCLMEERGLDLDRIRQVILFATPSFGSPLAHGMRRFLFSLLPNRQEFILRVFDPQIRELHVFIRDHVLLAKERGKTRYALPFFCFWGDADNIVPEAYAKGFFEQGKPLPGDHNTLHAPETLTDKRYKMFCDALMHPHGHANIWEIEDFLFRIQVEPKPPNTEIEATHGTTKRIVRCDNVALVTRKVYFSRHNRSMQPFTLKYGTRNGGWLTAKIEGEHIPSPDKARVYEDHGFDVWYDIRPTPGTTAELEVQVYKGFDEGHRDFHMHLGRASYFRRVRYEVDLTAYVSAGWKVVGPKLYFHGDDRDGHALCANRARVKPDPPGVADPTGVWKWDLEFLTEGVVDIVWDLQAPEAADG